MKVEKMAKNGQMVQNCYPLSPIVQAGKFANNKNAQNIYKTHLDFASPLASSKNLKKSNTTVHTVGTIKGMDSPVATHSIDQFSPTPTEVHADGTVSVKRQSAKQSIKKGIKHTDVSSCR